MDWLSNNRNNRIQNETRPEQAANLGAKKGTDDAFCTDCHVWYDSSKPALVNRHAH